MRLSVLFVNYRSAALLERALASWQADAHAAGVAVEWVVVDNGDDEAGQALLRRLPVRLLAAPRNLGYAGGVNLGLTVTSGDAIAVANPDLELFAGATAALLSALEEVPIAGPAFVWDRGGTLLLPPAQRRTRRDEVAEIVARASPRGAWLARQRWRRHARKFWEATGGLLRSHDLSGALLVLRREALAAVGPFDDAYPLYFEETDWLARAAAAGLAAAYVPAARVLHLHAASSAREPAAAAWFEQSAERFRRRHYGEEFATALRGLAARVAAGTAPGSATAPGVERPAWHRPRSGEGADWWLELSPREEGFPAVGQRLVAADGEALGRTPGALAAWRPPADVSPRLHGSWVLRLVSPDGEEVAVERLAGEAGG
jgi:GT2 family glycosyltransferase